ncbi:hypothetical protein AQUSIP_18300 [Aquicella siphonis]|uniref:Tetratricopeptide repeat protein n=1 Tax=Aquicella siphonis TaxID=254247 RepID=A0A5E4PJA4_9COXI|nr:hypothetical protein [Aquicella siphonis]VVC76517.1 hypothetical protein AQUSIP_18300 [Aquicella siphonis]
MHGQSFLNEPSLTDSHTALKNLQKGIQYNASKKFEKAARILLPVYQFFSHYREECPETLAQAAYFLGCSLMELDEPRKACPYLLNAYRLYYHLCKQELHPDLTNLRILLINSAYDLTQCRMALNKTDEAATDLADLETLFQQILPPVPDDNLKLTLGNIYLLLAEYGASNAPKKLYYLKLAMELAPSLATDIKYGIVLMQTGEYASAAHHLTRLISNTAWSADTQSLLADALHHLGKCKLHLNSLDQAIVFLKKAAGIYHHLNDTLAEMSTNLGLALCYNKTDSIFASEALLERILVYVKKLDHASSLQAAFNIISDWCKTANLPEGYNLNAERMRQLSDLFIRQEQQLRSENSNGY